MSVNKTSAIHNLFSRKPDDKAKWPIKAFSPPPYYISFNFVRSNILKFIFESTSIEHGHSSAPSLLTVQLGSLKFTAEKSGCSTSLCWDKLGFNCCAIFPTDGHESVIKKAFTTIYRQMAVLYHV